MQRGAIATVDIADPEKSWHCRGLLSRREIAICNSSVVHRPSSTPNSTGNPQADAATEGERKRVEGSDRLQPGEPSHDVG